MIDTERCLECGRCVRSCPVLPSRILRQKMPKAYAAVNRDEGVRMASSSGGIFSLLAGEIISRGGVVFGAAFTEDFHAVRHIAAETEEELALLRGSKYVQSTIGSAYQQAKACLDNRRWVLFSGTPCQIEGLRTFLGRDPERLLCVDLICHGVPSPKVWGKYVEYREKVAAAQVKGVSFRRKENYGWKQYGISFHFSNGTVYSETLSKDPYMKTFLESIALRPCCHHCSFKTCSRSSDLTLADFWGVENVLPDWNDDKGVSLVLIQSDKGNALFEGLMHGKMAFTETDTAVALASNSSAIQSFPEHRNRRAFFAHLDTVPFDRLVSRYTAPTLLRHGAALLRKIGILDTVKKLLHKAR